MLLTNKQNLFNSSKIASKIYFERRIYPRLKVIDLNIIVEIKSFNEKKILKAQIIDIGNGGIMIQSKNFLPIGDESSLKFKLPAPFNLIEGSGTIKWGLENNKDLYYGIKFNKFKDEIYTAQFYDFLNENSIKKDIKDILNEKNEKINTSSDRIPKNKKKENNERRKKDRRKEQILINFLDRRINEQRKEKRRQNEDRRKDKSSILKEKRNNERRKIDFIDYSKEFIDHRRNWLSKKLNIDLDHIGSYSMDPQNAKGNIENMIGATQVPIGIAGPCKVNGEYAKGDFYIPLATTEGALVMTYQRGMMAINLSGGANVKILKNRLHISPVFLFNNINECAEFTKWIDQNFIKIKKEAQKTTKHGKLLSIEPHITGNKVILTFNYNTGDAAGQNMISIATDAACNYIFQQTGHNFYLKSNFSSDKKPSGYNYIKGYGKSLIADITIPKDILQRIFNINPEDIYDLYQSYIIAGNLSQMFGINSHFANGLTALFLACGQDVANVVNSQTGFAYWDCVKNASLYVSIYLPSLITGTIGGGTVLGTQKECLSILDCYGEHKSKKFAEIAAVLSLAGEISLGAALAQGSFAQAHLKHGRS